MSDDALVRDVLEGFTAYVQRYGLPASSTQFHGIIGSLFSIRAQAANQTLSPQQIDRIIQLVKTGFDAQSVSQAVVDQSKQVLAEQAHQWRQDLEQQVRGVLDAYIQQYAPGVTPDTIREMVMTVAPMVKEGQVNKPEVMGLVEQMADTFAPDSPLSTVINPTYLALANDVATVFSQQDTETAVSETVTAYVEKFAPTAHRVGEDLIENALNTILKNKVEFGIDTELNLADRRLIIQQVSFKLNIMEQSPLPSKTAQQMADELNIEIERFKAERRRRLGDLDVTAGRLSNDGLSISSHWVFTDRAETGDATEG